MLQAKLVLPMLLCLALPLAAEQSSRRRAAFETELVMATAEDDALTRWTQYAAAYETVTEFRTGQTAIAQARTRGCDPGDAGACRVTVQYTMTGPDGAGVHEAKAETMKPGARPPTMTYTFSARDAEGLYRVVTLVSDLTGKRMVRAERVFGFRK